MAHDSIRVALLAVAAVAALRPAIAQTPSSPPAPEQVSAAPAQPAGAQAAAPAGVAPSLTFDTPVAIVVNSIKPDKTGDFETVMARLREGLGQSADPVRQQQLAGWTVLKATEPGPGGAVLYFFMLDPVVPGADYTVSRILAELYPDEVAELWTKLREAYAGGINRVSLQPVPAPAPAAALPVKK